MDYTVETSLKRQAQQIQEEIDRLSSRKKELKEQLKDTRSFTNSTDDYLDTTLLKGQIDLIGDEIKRLEIQKKNLGTTGNKENSVVEVHDTIKIKRIFDDDSDIIIRKIVESNPNHQTEISKGSPIGNAILGHHVGDSVTVTVTDKNGQVINTYKAVILEKI